VRAFLDSNILIYAFSDDPRSERARQLLVGGIVGIQSLNEFANVALKRLGLNWDEVDFALDRILRLCELDGPIDLEIHRTAMLVARRYKLAVYDALILAAALRASCDRLWSEDMHDGLLVEGQVTVSNPFR